MTCPQNSGFPTRRRASQKDAAALLAALAAFEGECACKPSLIVACAVNGVSGCRERRQNNSCACRERWLPSCLQTNVHGCAVWREGKPCQCPRLWLPRCLVVGCAERRRGKRCDCPRAPVELCPHLRAKIARYGKLTPAEANRIAAALSRLQLGLLTHLYEEPPSPSCGATTSSREAAVALMSLRQVWGLQLRHPDDRRTGHNVLSILKGQADGLKRLFGARRAVAA